MLVFQKNTGHVLEDGCKRAGMDPKWLVEAVAEMNLYLPDDWRLTRSESNFRIQIVSSQSATLVGSCYRTEGDRILHIIDSLHLAHFHDCVDLSHRHVKGKVDKKEHADVLTPNLYYFRPGPEGFDSPLFARQYERIRVKADGTKAGDQFHRIHPLYGRGLDLEHFLWIRWDIAGTVTVIEKPDSAYHGKDYWKISRLKECRNRGSLADYIRTYDEVLNRYGVLPPSGPEKAPTPYETEYKFTVPGDETKAAEIFNTIYDLLAEGKDIGGFVLSDQDRRRKKQADIYFDDERFTLYHTGASFRMRKKDSIHVTLKKKFPVPAEDRGLYQRIEEEAVITDREESALMAGKSINAFPYRLIPYIAPECGLLRPVVIVSNDRRVLHIRDANYRKAEICFDRVTFHVDGRDIGPIFEIEIESKGALREEIGALAKYMEVNLGVEVSGVSKYERGVELKN